MVLNTKSTSDAGGPSGGDIWAKWGVWIGMAALAVALIATWLSGLFSTNGRIDALYPTILQQTKDMGSIESELHVAGEKITTAQVSLTAAAAQNAELAKGLADLQEKQVALLAKQEDQVANIQDIKKSINDMSSNIASRLDQLQGRMDRISVPLPIKKTDFLEGSYVFASPKLLDQFGPEIKASGVASVTSLNLDEPDSADKAIEAWKSLPYRNSFLWLTKDQDAGKAFLRAWEK